MATAMTYTSLVQDLQQYLERGTPDDPTVFDQLPRLINLAERSIATELKILGFINVVTSTLTAGVSVYAKPTRWRETVSINFGLGASQVRTPLFPRSYEYCRSYWPDEDIQGQPLFYSDYDYNNWLIAPTPNANMPFEAIYYQLLPLLDAVNQTNWLTDFAPNLLLHGTLLKCTPFLKNDERIPTWQTLYATDLQAFNTQDLGRIIDRTTSRQEA
jgi:hypothetical protein